MMTIMIVPIKDYNNTNDNNKTNNQQYIILESQTTYHLPTRSHVKAAMFPFKKASNNPKEYPNSNDMMGCFLRTGGLSRFCMGSQFTQL